MDPAPELRILSEAKTQSDCMKKRLCSQESDSSFLRCSEIGQPSRVDSMNPVLSISLPLIFALTLGQSLALCIPVDYVIHVEKRECGYCLAINTTICEGYCMTWDSNVKKLLPRRPSALFQDVCTYKEVVYRTVMIPGCQHHAVSYYSYPVAVSCKCGKCNTDYSDCVQEASGTGYCAMF